MAKKADAVQNAAQASDPDKDGEQRGCIVEVGTPLWQCDGRMRHVQFKAGKLYVVDNMVYPDPRKGYVTIEQDYDHVMHFCWMGRTAGGAKEDDITPEPYDTIFRRVNKCKTGRVYMLKVRSVNKNHFFWMQEPSAEKDTEICAKVNYLLNFPPPWLRFPRIACNLEVAEFLGEDTRDDGGVESSTNDIEKPRGSHMILDFENCEALLSILGSLGNSQYCNRVKIITGAETSNSTELCRMRQSNVPSGSSVRHPNAANFSENDINSLDNTDLEYVDTERALYQALDYGKGTSAPVENSDTAKQDNLDVEMVQASGVRSVRDGPMCEPSTNLLCEAASLEKWESAIESPYLACSGDNTCPSGTAPESAEHTIQPSFGLDGDPNGYGSNGRHQLFPSSRSLEDWESVLDHGSSTNTRFYEKSSDDNGKAGNVESTMAPAFLQHVGKNSSAGSWGSALEPDHSAEPETSHASQSTLFRESSGLAGSSSFDSQSVDAKRATGTRQNIPTWKLDHLSQPGCSKALYLLPQQSPIVNTKSRDVFSIFASTLTSYSDEEDENYISDSATCNYGVKDENHLEGKDSDEISRETVNSLVDDASITNTIAMIVLAPANDSEVNEDGLENAPSSRVVSQRGSPGAMSESSSGQIDGPVLTSGPDPPVSSSRDPKGTPSAVSHAIERTVAATVRAGPMSGAIDTQGQRKSKSNVRGEVGGPYNVKYHLRKRPDQRDETSRGVPVQKKVRRASPGVPLPSPFRVQDVSPVIPRYPQPNRSKLMCTPNQKSSRKRQIYQGSDSDEEVIPLKRTRISFESHSSEGGPSSGRKPLRSQAESAPLLKRTSRSKDTPSTNSGRYNLRKRSDPAKIEDGQQTEPVRIREINKTGPETVVRTRANLQPPRARNDRANRDQGQNTRPVFVENRSSKSKPKIRKAAESNKKPKS